MTRLHQLFDEQGQSPWLDNLQRSYLADGTLQRLVGDGIRGVTSNPTIFQKAISSSADYDEQFASASARLGVAEAYWELVVDDIRGACDVLRPVHDASGGSDGFVSIEVSPALAHDTDGTVAAARDLYARVDRPNVMVKVPATEDGVRAVRTLVAEGRDVNITLIFSLPRYGQVMEAYLSGLEELVSGGGDPARTRSVASFFVSRVDTEVDRRLEQVGTPEALDRRGRAAVAQARLAYQAFRRTFSGPRWEALASRGANVQRPLWASTSTKNPAYPDLLYVDSLIGPDTVDTLPEPTVEAFLDHGTVARTVDADPEAAAAEWEAIGRLVDLDDVARVLEEEGVSSFAKSFDVLLEALEDKAARL